MASVAPAEVTAGLVVHLDTDELRRIGGSQTNAERTQTEDRAVVGPHYFLVVEVDEINAVAVPLFSKYAPGSEHLSENRKSGLAEKWLNEQSFFSRWQHWHIPVAALAASSSTEESEPNNRRRYAAAEPAALQAIAAWQAKNRAAFRAL